MQRVERVLVLAFLREDHLVVGAMYRPVLLVDHDLTVLLRHRVNRAGRLLAVQGLRLNFVEFLSLRAMPLVQTCLALPLPHQRHWRPHVALLGTLVGVLNRRHRNLILQRVLTIDSLVRGQRRLLVVQVIYHTVGLCFVESNMVCRRLRVDLLFLVQGQV